MANPIMIRVVADNGKQFLLNMTFIEAVEFPSPIGVLANNLNVERVTMQGGEVIPLVPGTWDAAVTLLYAEFNENPQPLQNVKGELYIMPTLP